MNSEAVYELFIKELWAILNFKKFRNKNIEFCCHNLILISDACKCGKYKGF